MIGDGGWTGRVSGERPRCIPCMCSSYIPGAPAYVGKAMRFQRNSSQIGLKDLDLSGYNAIQGHFLFDA